MTLSSEDVCIALCGLGVFGALLRMTEYKIFRDLLYTLLLVGGAIYFVALFDTSHPPSIGLVFIVLLFVLISGSTGKTPAGTLARTVVRTLGILCCVGSLLGIVGLLYYGVPNDADLEILVMGDSMQSKTKTIGDWTEKDILNDPDSYFALCSETVSNKLSVLTSLYERVESSCDSTREKLSVIDSEVKNLSRHIKTAKRVLNNPETEYPVSINKMTCANATVVRRELIKMEGDKNETKSGVRPSTTIWQKAIACWSEHYNESVTAKTFSRILIALGN